MKFNSIVGFGDSWMWGDELLDPALRNHPDAHVVMSENIAYREENCFLGRLGKHYDVPVINFGWPGGSLRSAIWTYIWWYRNQSEIDQSLILVGHTGAWRTSFYNPQFENLYNNPPWNTSIHSSWLNDDQCNIKQDWVDLIKRYMCLSDCQALHELNYTESLLFWSGIQKLHCGVYQFCVVPPPCQKFLDNSILPNQSVQDLLMDRSDRQDLFHSKGHPNERGHEIIAKILIEELDRVIISE